MTQAEVLEKHCEILYTISFLLLLLLLLLLSLSLPLLLPLPSWSPLLLLLSLLPSLCAAAVFLHVGNVCPCVSTWLLLLLIRVITCDELFILLCLTKYFTGRCEYC